MRARRSVYTIFLLMLMGVNFCLYAADYYWDFVDALSKNEVRKIEQILKDNAPGMTESEKRHDQCL